MDYLCAKFGNFDFIVQTDRITEVDQRYTHATTVSVSNKCITSTSSWSKV